MVASRPKLATFADLAALPSHVRAEVIHGAIVEKAATSFEHGSSQAGLSSALLRRFHRKPGGRWPGGWWFATEAEVQYETHEIFAHDLAGWRRDRTPERPSGRPVLLRPDWVCELVSPSNAKHDRVDKLQVLYRHGAPYYWIADPIEHVLTVHRWTENGYLVVLAAKAGDAVRGEPFDAVELRVSALFALEDDDE
jgi:Uma2 family endonuclease